jgi:hypothetical protein
LIENQNKKITSLSLNEIYIYEEILETIYINFNLKQFLFSCETLSLKKKNFRIDEISKKLKILKIFWCKIIYDSIDSSSCSSKVRFLILFSRSLRPKVMESIAKLFLNLKRLDLSYYKVICECDQQIDNNYICIECHQKFDKFLSKMMIKVELYRYKSSIHWKIFKDYKFSESKNSLRIWTN